MLNQQIKHTFFISKLYSCLKDQSFDSSSPLETELSSSDTNIHSGTVNSQNWSKKHIIYEVDTDCTCMQWCAQVVNWTHLYNMYSSELHPRRGYLCLEVVDTTTPVWAHHCTHTHLTIYRPQSGNDADVVWVVVVWVGVSGCEWVGVSSVSGCSVLTWMKSVSDSLYQLSWYTSSKTGSSVI